MIETYRFTDMATWRYRELLVECEFVQSSPIAMLNICNSKRGVQSLPKSKEKKYPDSADLSYSATKNSDPNSMGKVRYSSDVLLSLSTTLFCPKAPLFIRLLRDFNSVLILPQLDVRISDMACIAPEVAVVELAPSL